MDRVTAVGPSGPDQVMLSVHHAETGLDQFGTVRELYADAYAESPYFVGPVEVEDFAARWPVRVAKPNFRLVLAHRADQPIGFVFGYQLGADTTWWDAALTPLSEHVATEWAGRTFAIIEIGVRRPYRCCGVARRMHTELIAGLSEQRVALLVLPNAPEPRRAYLSWGYRPIGRVRPFPHGPVYDAMIKSLTADP